VSFLFHQSRKTHILFESRKTRFDGQASSNQNNASFVVVTMADTFLSQKAKNRQINRSNPATLHSSVWLVSERNHSKSKKAQNKHRAS